MLFGFSLIASVFADEQVPAFRLVGIYDSSSVLGVSSNLQSSFMWQSSRQMENSCGPAKGPDALGLFEAEMIANQMAPGLMVLLEYNSEPNYIDATGKSCDPELQEECTASSRSAVTAKDVTIGIGIDQVEFQLQPMVEPRYLSIRIDGYVEGEQKTRVDPSQLEDSEEDSEEAEESTDDEDQNLDADGNVINEAGQVLFDTARYQKLIRTQLEIETCLEHKVGRGWLGNDRDRLRQAFLLDPPDGDRLDRKYFSGQRDPISAYLGPTDACVVSSAEMPKDLGASKGESSMTMTPSDVWGASLRDCEKRTEDPGRPLMSPTRTLPLAITENGVRQARLVTPKWSGLEIDVEALGPKEEDVMIKVRYNGEPVDGLDNVALFPEPGAMVDILARLSHTYPRIGTKEDPHRFISLIVPNWQIVEGLRRMYSRTCIEDSPERYCRCSVRSFEADLGDGETLDEKLDDLDNRLRCVDLDNEICHLSRDVPQLDLADGEEPPKSSAERCLERLLVDEPMVSGGQGIHDGVGWLMSHPQFLFVQVPTLLKKKEGFHILDHIPSLESKDAGSGGGSSNQLPNLADASSGGFLGLQDWGYTVGLLNGRSPIVLPIKDRLIWDISAQAQRSLEQSYFIIALFILLSFGILGVRRVHDFWMRTPEERAYYWPGRQNSQEEPKPEGVDLEGQNPEE